MDFNYFYHREQVSMMRADAASCEKSRAAHQELADGYARTIALQRSIRGAAPLPAPLAANDG
jgi:hypothetical protein